MSPHRTGLLATLVAAAALVALTAAPATGTRSASRPAYVDPPCDIHARRQVEPLVVSEGRSVAVDVSYGFDCPTSQRKVNLHLLVNGPAVASGDPSLIAINAALNTALGGYLARIDRSIGSRGAYGVFGSTFGPQWPLKSFSEWPGGLGAWVTPAIDTSGLLPALQHAAGELPADPGADGASNVVVAVIGSSRPIGSTDDIQAACSALAAVNARLVVIALESLRGSGGLHDLTCIDTFLRGTDTAGADLAYVFDSLAATTIDPPRMQTVEVFDGLSEPFAYEAGSGQPREPTTVLGNDLTWTFDAPGSGEHTLGYRVAPASGWTDVRRQLSREAYVRFVYADGGEATEILRNPTMCIHAFRHPAFCADLPAYLPLALRRSSPE